MTISETNIKIKKNNIQPYFNLWGIIGINGYSFSSYFFYITFNSSVETFTFHSIFDWAIILILRLCIQTQSFKNYHCQLALPGKTHDESLQNRTLGFQGKCFPKVWVRESRTGGGLKKCFRSSKPLCRQ